MSDETITYEEARLRLHDHIGEHIYFGLWSAGEVSQTEIISLHGTLTHPVEASADLADANLPAETRDTFGATYTVEPDAAARAAGTGRGFLNLPPLPGTITETDNGLNFDIAEGVRLRIAWRGTRGRRE